MSHPSVTDLINKQVKRINNDSELQLGQLEPNGSLAKIIEELLPNKDISILTDYIEKQCYYYGVKRNGEIVTVFDFEPVAVYYKLVNKLKICLIPQIEYQLDSVNLSIH